VAGKTGTARDGWFAGYTPNLVCVVWVGFDDGTELGLTGAESALPVWTEFVRRAVELRPELGGQYFERPDAITTVEIDPETGLRASPSCPARERVALAPGFAPGYECLVHSTPLPVYADYELEPAPATTAVVAANVPQPARLARPAPPPIEVPRLDDASPAVRTTRAEISRDGRRRLTTELNVAPPEED